MHIPDSVSQKPCPFEKTKRILDLLQSILVLDFSHTVVREETHDAPHTKVKNEGVFGKYTTTMADRGITSVRARGIQTNQRPCMTPGVRAGRVVEKCPKGGLAEVLLTSRARLNASCDDRKHRAWRDRQGLAASEGPIMLSRTAVHANMMAGMVE